MADRWNSLVEESSSHVLSEGTKNFTGNFSFLGVFILIALIAAFVIKASMRGGIKTMNVSNESLTVLQPKIVAELNEKQPAASENELPTVSVKRTAVESKYFSSEQDNLQEPFLHTENGQSFSDFAKTLDSGRETYSMERPMSSKTTDLNYLKSDLKRRGLGLEDFVDTYGLSVSDNFVDTWKESSYGPSKREITSKPDGVSDDEVRMLAQESLQPLSITCDTETANSVLREILAARTEAGRIGLEIPPLTEEQLKAIKFWSNSKAFKTSTIAKTLLGR